MKYLILIFSLCLLIPMVTAEYPFPSYQGDISFEDAIFSTSIIFEERTFTQSQVVTNPLYMPFTADLDNDGLPEIIIYDGTTIRLYQNESLNIIDAINIPSASSLSPPAVADTDGDGLNDLVVVSLNNPHIAFFLEYNGTDFYIDGNTTLSSLISIEMGIVGCGTDQCMYVQPTRNDINTLSSDSLNIDLFNRSSSTGTTIYSTGAGGKHCFSQIPSVQYGDHNNDGVNSFVFTTFQYNPSGSETYRVSMIDDDLSPSLDYSFGVTAPISFSSSSNGVKCSNLYRSPPDNEPLAKYSFSDALMFNFDKATGTGLEFFIAYLESPTEYRMASYTSEGVLVDEHPDAFFVIADVQEEATGGKLSNIYRTSLFDSGGFDACVNGIQDNGMSVVCASFVNSNTDLASNINNDVEFEFSPLPTSTHNITFDNRFDWSSYARSSTMGTSETSTFFAPKMVTGNGIWSFSKTIFSTLGDIFTLGFTNENTIGEGSVLLDDATGSSQQDLLVLGENNIFYIDDLFVNSPAKLTSFTINPCIEGNIKLNTSMNVQVVPEDVNSDQVRARVTYYAGSSNEIQSDWTPYASSGTTFSFTEKLNITFSNAELLIEVNDIENNESVEETSFFYSVASEGFEYGDCTTTGNFDLIDEDEEVSSIQDTGEACTLNEQCDSGLCQNNQCTLKPFKASCTINDECLSGSCDNGICSKSSSWESIDSGVKNFLGADVFTLNMIAIVIILFLTGFFIASVGVSNVGLVVSAFVFIISSFFFTLVGWLSAWFSISIFIFMLIAMVVLIMFKTNEG